MAEKRYILYKHTSPSGKVYIGITCKSETARWGVDGSGYRLNPYFWKAIKKYGWDNIKHEVLFRELTKDEACKMEMEYIAEYRSNDQKYGYNMTSGGEVGYRFSPGVSESISSALKERWKNLPKEEKEAIIQRKRALLARATEQERKDRAAKASQTIRERYSAEEIAEQRRRALETRRATMAERGGVSDAWRAARSVSMKKYWDSYHLLHPKKKLKYHPPRVHIKLTPEGRIEAAREAMKRRWQDPEYRKKMDLLAASMVGTHRSLSEETKAKMRKPKSEETKAKMRKPKSEETRRKMSEAKKKYFATKRNLKTENPCFNQTF